MKQYKKNIKFVIYMLMVTVAFAGCKKFVVVGPPITSISSATVFSNNTSAAAAMTSIYATMIGNNTNLTSGEYSLSCLMGLSADELTNYMTNNTTLSQFYTNSISNANGNYWTEIYQQLHVTNTVIEGLNNSTTLSLAVKKQLLGEAKFMRAFLHFYAVNLFGDVPLIVTSDYTVNSLLSRTPTNLVYDQIIQDLKDAQDLLPDGYATGTAQPATERVRPNKGAVTALLARVYLFKKDWANAKIQASSVILNANYHLEPDLNQVFLNTSQEAIWQLQSIAVGYDSFDAPAFVLISAPGGGNTPVALSSQQVATFEPGDGRYANWVGVYIANGVNYFYPNKYKIWQFDPSRTPTEYTTVLRLSEQYLIRAEAEIQLGDIAGGVADMNVIRTRARLSPTTQVPSPLPDLTSTLTQEAASKAVLHERQVELFTEWGHRWFDLKRTGNIDAVMAQVAPLKNTTWQSYKSLLPIPVSEIVLDNKLKQNPGY